MPRTISLKEFSLSKETTIVNTRLRQGKNQPTNHKKYRLFLK
jgi:hypothetical protein